MTAIPPLPDTERRTQYSPAGSTGPFDFGFALYGDGADYQNWIEVWLNGVQLNVSADWTLASPSGPLANLARPITDAQVTLVAAATGTLEIVGDERPRRTTQLVEGKGFTAHDFNLAYTDVKATQREMWDKFARVVRAPGGETMVPLPPAAQRANLPAAFDALGNMIAASQVAPGVPVSTAMVPVLAAATTAIAVGLLGIAAVPAGAELDWPGLIAPSGWYFEYGQTIPRTTNPNLLAAIAPTFVCVITGGSNSITGISSTDGWYVGMPIEDASFPPGTTVASIPDGVSITTSVNALLPSTTIQVFPFGNGDGSTTFNVPDGRDVTYAGKGNMGGTAANRLTSTYFGDSTIMGKLAGSDHVTLTTPQIPAHSHTYDDPGHAHNLTPDGSTQRMVSKSSAGAVDIQPGGKLEQNPSATQLAAIGITIQNTGGGGGHTNVQPTSIRNKIIKGG